MACPAGRYTWGLSPRKNTISIMYNHMFSLIDESASTCTKSSRGHTSIIISLGRMRLVEVLKFIIFFLVLAMAHFMYKLATLMERSDCRLALFLLCIGAALVVVLGTVVAVLEGREDEHEGRREREQKASERSQKDWKDESERRQKDWVAESERKQKDWKDESERKQND